MFNNQALDALKSLKADIRTAKNITRGTVRATPQKFGFVIDNEGQQHFIVPDVMDGLLPDDEIDFYLKEVPNGDPQVTIEKLIKQNFKSFCGRVVMRGKHMFVEADAQRFSRWFFVPPNARSKANDGDLVVCSVIKHPSRLDGKSQAKIQRVIGSPKDTHNLLDYQCEKHGIQHVWEEQNMSESAALKQIAVEDHQRTDLRDIPFVTIDSEQTKDMDDAIFVQRDTAGNFSVRVAIADPWSYLKHSPSLSDAIIERGISCYFPTQTIHMMPEGLSQDLFSLREGEERNAIVVNFKVDNDGNVIEPSIELAKIISSKKMSYEQVQSIIDSSENTTLDDMINCFKRLAEKRRQHHVILTDRPDYFFQFDECKQVKNITKVSKLLSHKLVEEYMIATNIVAAQWLKEHHTGLFVSHQGFRPERQNDLDKLIKEYFATLKTSPKTPDEFAEFMNESLQRDEDIPLRSVLTRWLAPAKITATPDHHLGLGFNLYTTITSPIRKGVDLVNHRCIHDILSNSKTPELRETLVEALNATSSHARQAVTSFEGSLRTNFAKQNFNDKDEFEATIAQVNSAGLIIRLDETGIEGFIDFRVKKGHDNDLKFEGWRLSTTKAGQFYHVDQPLRVRYEKARSTNQQLRFTLV